MTLRQILAGTVMLLLPLTAVATELAAPGRAACEILLQAADAAQPVPADLAPAEPGVAGADFVPGVDVYGRPVAPAGAGAVLPDPLPDEFVLPIQPLVAPYVDGALPAGLEDLRVGLGEVVVRRSDGRVTFNGQPIGADANAALVEACRGALEAEAPAAP